MTLRLHQVMQRMRAPHVRARFDAEERDVLAADLTRLRVAHGPQAVLRQWPALLRDGLADAVTTRRVSARDTLTRRAGDLVAAALLGLPAAAITLALAALVRSTSRGPAFVHLVYRGRAGHPVRLRKLRTMTVAEPRNVTRLGRVLRAVSLDEIPTLLALARGDVTVVGPRLQPAGDNAEVLLVRPGLVRWPRSSGPWRRPT
jgi:lipopolysaccharide/colanic/teichoic acid biosynthesis glycosyltransferase